MPSSEKWIDAGLTGKISSMNTQIAMDFNGVNSLYSIVVTPPLSHIIFGDYTKWCSNLLYFPFDTTKYYNSGSYLEVGGAETDVPCYPFDSRQSFGYTLGEYHYTATYNDFRDYEPYTTLQIYLPFYGSIELPIADVIGKYIQFRLKVDFTTGQAMYIIGVNSESVSTPNPPLYIGTDDANTVILSQIVFNIGTSIPLGTVGMADTIRNITMGVARGVAIAGGAYTVGALGLSSSQTTTKTITTARNPVTGRQIRTGTETKTQTYDGTNYQKGRAINACFNTAVDALNNMSLSPRIDSANNTFVDDNGSKSIHIIRRFAKVVPVDANYNALYGQPLGETRQLDLVHGYTEVSNIHFEGVGFGSATNKELAMIEQEFVSGVILP